MRPTLIKQKPGPRVEPVRLGLLYGILYLSVGFAWFVGDLCTYQLLNCGMAHGLGPLEYHIVRFGLPWVFVLLFSILICAPGAMGAKWKRPTGVPWVGLMGIAALLLGIYLLPQFVTRNRRPWPILGPAPLTRTSPQGIPAVTGTWEGRFDSNPALLIVTHQNGKSFDGELLIRFTRYTYKLAVQGTLNRSGAVNIQETQVLDEAFYHDWALGTETGTRDPAALEMQGRGVDTRGTRYHWVLEYASATVYIPEN